MIHYNQDRGVYMNKLSKILTTGLLVASIGVIGVNAETVDVGNKSYTFTEFEEKGKINKLVYYEDKMYGLTKDRTFKELLFENNIKLKDSDLDPSIFNLGPDYEKYKEFNNYTYKYKKDGNGSFIEMTVNDFTGGNIRYWISKFR